MINMMTVLVEKSCGKMEFSYVTGDKYYEYLCHRMDNYLPMADFDNEVEDSLLPELDVDRLAGIFFNDPQAACALINDPAKFSGPVHDSGHQSQYGLPPGHALILP